MYLFNKKKYYIQTFTIMKINVEGGELVLRNEHGDTIIVPRERRKEAMSALLKDDHRAIDSLALQLPKASRYAAGGTVLDGQDPIKSRFPIVDQIKQPQKNVNTTSKKPTAYNKFPITDAIDKEQGTMGPETEIVGYKDKGTHQFFNQLQDRVEGDELYRANRLWNIVGKPKVRLENISGKGLDRAHFNPFTNTMHISNEYTKTKDQLEAEDDAEVNDYVRQKEFDRMNLIIDPNEVRYGVNFLNTEKKLEFLREMNNVGKSSLNELNEFYIDNNINEFVAESGHAAQKKLGLMGIPSMLKMVGKGFSNVITEIGKNGLHKKVLYNAQKALYDDPSSIEYIHRQTDDPFMQYVRRDIKPNFKGTPVLQNLKFASGGNIEPDPTLLKPKPYKPSDRVLDAKGALAGISLAGNAFAPTIGYSAQLLNVGGDLYTGTRYAMDGQYKKAAIDYGQALVGMIPSSRVVKPKSVPGAINLKKTRVVDNKTANYLNTALDLLDLSNVPSNYDIKKKKTKQ